MQVVAKIERTLVPGLNAFLSSSSHSSVNFYPIFKSEKSKSEFTYPLSECENISLIQQKAIFWSFVKQSAFLYTRYFTDIMIKILRA